MIPMRWRANDIQTDKVDDLPRLVRRNLPFNQSDNAIQVLHNQGIKILRLTSYDYFHVLLRYSLAQILILLIFLWTINILFFAGVYVSIDPHESGSCGLGLNGQPITWATAWGFSLQTATTVGYTLPNSVNGYFENCPSLQTAVFFQTTFSLLFNACLIAIVTGRIANSSLRAIQVIFSDKAIVSVMAGQVRLQIRVFDADARHPVVEAHVRLYAVMKDKPVPRPLRLIQPNDDQGAKMLLSLPQVICHHIDLYSLLHPPKPDNPTNAVRNGLDLRQADSLTCTREEVVCPVCSETYGTFERWVRHVQFNQIVEREDEIPVKGSHLEVKPEELNLNRYKPSSNLHAMQTHFEQEVSEVICVVEGIDPLTSGSFAAVHSYRKEDIFWQNGAVFHPCISAEADSYTVDLDRFHEIITKSGGRQQQLSIRPHDMFFAIERRPNLSSLLRQGHAMTRNVPSIRRPFAPNMMSPRR
ncbi:hypothetical protein MPSEU_000437800 [Mayamaea pseudoterrestris]|nr:hypothetical protein MPSEU_000437800 [Mayamaea pseudoterrestris]